MKLRKGRGYRRGRIEIIPMIDVMFFLLVTFMLASLSMQSLNSIAVNLPKGDAESLQHREPTTLDQLAFALKPLLKPSDPGVVVNADTDTPQGSVVQAMIQARRAGVEH